ncbi:MAG TPA: VTT domain-containing protein [Acidobacteriaceae bacterium]|nr:VTT domain-containing protein [Acidobacteriaceae bacterium]
MEFLLRAFVHHAYSILFGWVLMEQAGVPVPSAPVLLAAGTMSAAHKLHVAFVLPVVLLACLIADSMWFLLGRRYGTRIVNVLCKMSFEAASCVTRTQGSLARRGGTTMLFAKFVPGLSTMAAPLAGQSGLSYPAFMVYDVAGSAIWASAWLFGGKFFGDVIERSSRWFGMVAHYAVGLVLLMVVGVLVARYVRRVRFLRELRGLRLEPGQLLAMMEDAQREGLPGPFIVDLRHPLDVLSDPLTLPSALRIGPDELKQRKDLIPKDRDVVLYCTCPSEETSAKVALELRRLGVKRVRPLRGGLQGWKDAGYVLDAVEVVTAA